MRNESQGKNGSIRIADSAVISCAASAALETGGVAELSGKRGVKLSRGDSGMILDVFISVYYGSSIPAVCWDLQKNIKTRVESLSGENTAAINVHVQRVKFSPDKEEDFTGE